MQSENNIQKQYSENNNAAFGHYAVLLGIFLGFVAIYAFLLLERNNGT